MSLENLLAAMRICDLGPSEKLTMIYLADISSSSVQLAPFSIDSLCEFCGFERPEARVRLDALVEAGWIQTWGDITDDWIEVWVDFEGNGDFSFCHPDNVPSKSRRKAIPLLLREEIQDRDETCVYCGKESGPFQIDHIHPVSRGGENDYWNLALCCPPCNASKGYKLLSEWEGRVDAETTIERALKIQALAPKD